MKRPASGASCASLAIAILAAMSGGCDAKAPAADAPLDAAQERPAWLREEAAERGLRFTHVSGHDGPYWMPEIMGGGAALFDADADGAIDAYLVNSGTLHDGGPEARNALFRNLGGGRFADVSAGSGADDEGYGMGVACGDYDRDGGIDVYVTNFGANVLLHNEGGMHFDDRTGASGTGHPGWASSAAFVDYDRDGLLDLFVLNYLEWSAATEIPCKNPAGLPDYCSPQTYSSPARDVLYRNGGGGRFADVSEASGIGLTAGTGLGIACADFDEDGRIDVFVANDGMPDNLWMQREDGSFEDRGLLAGVALDRTGVSKAGMGVAVEDLDEDGDLDLMVCNLRNQSDSVFLNEGGFFHDGTLATRIAPVSRPFTRFGLGLCDFDADGRLDLFEANGRVARQSHGYSDDPYAEPNLLLRGTGAGAFEEVEPRGGTHELLAATSRGAAFGDVDDDGGIDVLVVNRDGPAHLLRNVHPARGNWIGFRLLEPTGADSLHATLECRAGERGVLRVARAGSSYQSSNDPRIHIGLGRMLGVEGIVVTWPDGARESFGARPAGSYHTLRRGAGE